MNDKWKPLFRLALIDIVNNANLKGVHIGSSGSVVHEVLGAPELPLTRLSKKSKIAHYLYGNVSILSEKGNIIAIDIDFHSNREQMVMLGEMDFWGINDWLVLCKTKSWDLNKTNSIVKISGRGVNIFLSCEGKVEMVSIR